MARTPTYEEVMSSNRRGSGGAGLRAFLRSLKEGVPKRAPENVSRSVLSSEMTRTGNEIGARFASRTISGVLWVVRVKEGDDA